jgi:uncharacterized repeat protein (TIGR01451 family)/fimbrial isopeptide formation D2 family protein
MIHRGRTWLSMWTLFSLLMNPVAPTGVLAAPSPVGTEQIGQSMPLLPAWFTAGSDPFPGSEELLPAWFTQVLSTSEEKRQAQAEGSDGCPLPTVSRRNEGLQTESLWPAWWISPPGSAWWTIGLDPQAQGERREATDGPPQTANPSLPSCPSCPNLRTPMEFRTNNTWDTSFPITHHTIYPSAVAVLGPDGPINNCDVVTFTIVAANDPFTTTGVIITSTMPVGFTPTQIVFNVGTVRPNEVITRYAVFTATCSAVSGQNVVTLTQDGYVPIVRYTDFVVNPGAIAVRKEPAVIRAGPDDIVTWTVYVENTGYGRVSNVRVTDTLGSGLQYVSGLTSAYVISIPVGGVVTFPVAARVVGCSNLENVVTATWGCNGEACLTPQVAKGAVDLQLRNPDLDFSLPAFNMTYCDGFGVFTVPITNNGDGTAYSGTLAVNLSPFSVTVAPPASYSGGAFHLPPIPPGGTYDLVFTLTLPSAVCGMPRIGTFDFNLTYYDRCGNPYAELPQSAPWQLVNAPGQLSVSKSMPREVYRGENVTATVTVNASGIVGSILVTDQVPAGWSVVNPAGGNVFTVGGATYITWTLTGTATLNPVFATPGVDGCAYCGTLATNIVTATASDCQNCRQTATAQASAYLQCHEPVATTFKQVSAPAETCTSPAFTYTNTYAFASSFIVTPTWQGMIFTDVLPYQTYIPGSASVWMSNGVLTCAAEFSQAVVGGMLVISNISPTCPIPVPGATMWISYTTAVTEPAACSDFEWYDWSYLNLGVTGNAECAADGVIEEGVFAQTLAPSMSLGLSGLPSSVAPCGIYTVTLTAQRTSAVGAYDAVIDVPTSTFRVLEVLGFSGATPAYTETDSVGYHWYYSDTFATATTGTVQLRVQLPCESGVAPFQGILYYDNRCADNDTYRERCSAGGPLGLPSVVQPLPILTKFPEVIYAHGDVVTWTLIAYNSGAGPACSVVLTDRLGSGLRYVDSSITSTMSSVAGVTPITSSHLVTWNLPVIQPKERVTIRFAAEIIGCTDLTNRFAGAQGCLGQTCQTAGPMQSRVELPPTIVLNTNQGVTPIDTCYTRTVTITVRNAGLTSVYSATLTETLPAGLFYIPGTTQVSTDTVNWQPGPEPTIVGQDLVWGPGSGAPLDALLSRIRPGETLYFRFDVRASCPFAGGSLRIQIAYRDPCGTPRLTNASHFLMPVRTANLSIVKVGENLSRTSPAPDFIYAEPGETVVFTITVSNPSSAAPARAVVVTDTLPGNLIFQGATPGYIFSGGPPGGVLTWTFDIITPATSVVLTVTAVVSPLNGCTVADTFNVAEVAWGCPDGCRQGARSDQVTLRTRPVYGTPGIRTDIPPAALHQCGGLITITLNNEGPPAYNVTLTDTLPSGYVFSGTVFASTPPSGTVDLGGTVVYTWGVLPTGLTTITLAVRNSVGPGMCAVPSGSNVITLTYDDDVPDCPGTGPYSTTATQAINVVRPNLVVDKSPATLTAQVGQRITWTLRLTNTGTGAAYNVVVTDVVGSSFISVTAAPGSDGSLPVIAGNVVTWTPAPIAAGGVWTAQVSAVVTATGVNRNIVTATASCDTGCLATSASSAARVTLIQAFDKGPAIQTGTIGSLVVFTFTATLPDADALYERVTLTDTLPTGLGYVGAVLTYAWDTDGSQGGPYTAISTTPTITPDYLASGNVVWRLGNLTGAVQIDGVITAVIQNITSNYEGVRLTNTLRLAYTDDGQPYVYTDTANVDILEPLLHIGKSYVTPYGCGATLLEDNFNAGVSGWSTTGGGTWVWSNGTYQAPTGGTGIGRISRKGNTGWTDYSYSAMIRSTSTSGHFGLVFRGPTARTNTFYRFRWGNEANNNRRLERIVGNSIQATLAQDTAAYVPGRWYHIEVRAEGNRLRIYVDGTLIFDVTDASANALTTGNIGVYAINQTNAYFDDILVTRLGNQSCYVGAGDRVTYTLTISNQSLIPGYDLVITDVVPAGMSLVTYTMTSNDPTAQVVAEPSPIPGATGVLTWGVNHLTPTVPYTWGQHTAITLTVVLSVSDGITANTVLSDQAFLSYSSQPGSGPVGVERGYSGGSHSAAVQTVNAGLSKTVTFSPPPTATLGTLVTYTLIIPNRPISATLYNVAVTDTVDSRMQIVAVTAHDTFWSYGWSGQVVTATFDSIPHNTQAYFTITVRIHTDLGARAGDVLTDVARMSHATAPVTNSNVVSTTVGEPRLLVDKSVESSTGRLTDLDGTALLTYTIRLTNTGTSPAYSVYITDAVPAGISVTALYGGDSRSAPVVGPGVLTWTVGYISNTAPANVVLLTYTARISQALSNAWLTNTVDILYHSLTETIPGVRPYTNTDQASVETAQPTVSKSTEPPVLRVGDIVTYHLVFTIPAGTVGMGGNSFLRDALPPGIWYITDSETLTWTPSTVSVTITSRVSTTTEVPGYQVIRWYFAPITSEQDLPTVVTLTFQAQAVGLRIDNLSPVWPDQTVVYTPTDWVELWQRDVFIGNDWAQNDVIQPLLSIDKSSTPPPGSYVGAGDRITYILTVTNAGHGPAYDIVISDVLPAQLFYVTSTVASAALPTIAFADAPTVGATGVLTWRVNELWGRAWNAGQPGVAVITVVAQVTDTVGANLILTNTAAIPYYDSQPGEGPGPYTPDEREYTDGADSVSHRTVDAAILKTVTPPTATLGDVVTYVVVVPATPITATLYHVTVTDQLDARLQLHAVADGPDGTVVTAGNGFTVTYASIPNGQQRFITVTAVLSSPLGAVAGNVITNLAVLRHRDGGPTPSNQPAFTVTEPSLTLVKASDPPTSSTVRVGEMVTYTVRITNSSAITASPAYDVVFTDTLPLGMRATSPALLAVTLNGAPVAATDYVTGYNPASGVFTVAFTPAFSVPVGGELVIQYVATVDSDAPAATDLTNRAEATWSSLPGPVPGDRDYGLISDTTTVHTPLATGLSKSVAPPTATVGSQVVFSITLPVPPVGAVLHNVVFTDVVDSRLRIDAVSPNAAFSGQVVTASFTTIPAYTQVTVIITATVRDLITVTAGMQITDVAVFDYRDNPYGPISSNPVTITVAEPNVTLDKSVQVPRDPLGAGDIVTYTLVLRNEGDSPAYDIWITDTLPPGLVYVATVAFTLTNPITAVLTDTNSPGDTTLVWGVSELSGDGPGSWQEVGVVFSPSLGVYYPSVLYDPNAFGHAAGDVISASLPYTYRVTPYYKMWVGTRSAPNYIQFAYSDDGIAWYQFNGGAPLPGLKSGGYHSVVLYDPAGFGDGFYYKIWYWDSTVSVYTITAIRTAESVNGIVWQNDQPITQDPTAPLIRGFSGTWDRGTYGPVWVLYNPSGAPGFDDTNIWNNRYVMYYDATTGAFEQVGIAYSADGKHWKRWGDGPVLPSGRPITEPWGQPTPWDSSYSTFGTVLRLSNGTWRFWYSGGTTASHQGIGLAFSGDGLRWAKAIGPMMHINDGVLYRTRRTYTPWVLYSPTAFNGHGPGWHYKMWFSCVDNSNNYRICHAYSALAPGGVLTITFTARVAWDIGAGLTLTNSAWGAYSSLPGPSTDERTYPIPTDTVPVRTGYPLLDIEKSAEPSPVEAGGLLTYTLTVTNTGIVSATGVVVTDAVPVYTTYLSCGPAPCSEAGGVVSWTLGTLDIGVPRVLTMLVQVNSPLPNGTLLTNTAWVTSTEGVTDTDTVTTPVSSAPMLHLVKSSTDANGGDLRPGDRITYTLVVSNTGNETALGVTVRDTVPAHTTYVPGSIAGGDGRDDSGLPVLVWTINSLPPSVPVYLTFAVTVNLPLTDGLQIVNTGAVTSTQAPTPTTDTVTDTVVSSHTLEVFKSASPSPARAGDLLTYTLAYTVTGDEPVYGVVVSDTVPENTTFVTATMPHNLVGNTVLWPLGDFLPPESGITQATGVLTLVVRVESPLVSGTVIYNAVVITDTSGLTDTDEITTPVESAHTLHITKTASPSPVQAGGLLTYTLAWAVTGNQPALGVTISDTLPVRTTYVACSGAPCAESGGVVTWALGTVNPPASGVVTLVVRVDSPLVSGTVIYNAVAITDTSGLTDTDEITTPVESSHSLSITKTADPAVVQAGDRLTYTLAWAVTGNQPAFGVTISDTVPVSTTYVACSGAPCAESGGVVTWALSTVNPPASGVVTLVVQVDSAALSGTLIYNAATITDTSGLSDTDDTNTPVQTRADLAVTKADRPDPVIVGTPLTYTLVVTNRGPSVARNVVVTDTLPSEVAFVSADPPQSSGPNPLVWSLGDLAVGEVRRLTVTVRVLVTTTDVFTNAVVVGSDTLDDNPGNNQDEEPTTPLAPGLELTKDVAPGQAVRNMPFTYTIRITNTGQVTFNPLVLTDTLPADFYYVRGSGVPTDPNVIAEPLLVWWNLGPLAPGESLTVTFAVTATPGITGIYRNVALVGGEHPGGVLTDTDDAPVAISDPAIALDKQLVAADLDDVFPNYVTFTIVITNIGISAIDVLPLVDQYDPHYLSFFWANPMPDDPVDDGMITWNDLTGPAPNGFGQDLAPGESFRITTVFRVVNNITATVNTAYVDEPLDVYNNPANEPRDDEPITNIPTAVELLYFRVGGTAGLGVRLEWATAVEIDNFGFLLYRAPVPDFAQAVEVAFVPSQAQGGGATYVYTDTVPSGGTWWYWLSDVDTSFRETRHGPVSVSVGTALRYLYRIYLPLILR